MPWGLADEVVGEAGFEVDTAALALFALAFELDRALPLERTGSAVTAALVAGGSAVAVAMAVTGAVCFVVGVVMLGAVLSLLGFVVGACPPPHIPMASIPNNSATIAPTTTSTRVFEGVAARCSKGSSAKVSPCSSTSACPSR